MAKEAVNIRPVPVHPFSKRNILEPRDFVSWRVPLSTNLLVWRLPDGFSRSYSVSTFHPFQAVFAVLRLMSAELHFHYGFCRSSFRSLVFGERIKIDGKNTRDDAKYFVRIFKSRQRWLSEKREIMNFCCFDSIFAGVVHVCWLVLNACGRHMVRCS